MAKTDALFLLVKSLNAGEKALVRQVDKGQAAYLALFDYLCRQREYDERKAKKKLLALGHDINFAFAKNYLTKHILKVLRTHEEDGVFAGSRQAQEIELLMRRHVYELAEKLVGKARARSLEEERWNDFLRLSESELALVSLQGGKLEDGVAEIARLNGERKQARKQLAELGEYEDLYHHTRSLLRRKQAARNELDLALVQDWARSEQLASDKVPASARSARYYHLSRVMLAAYSGQTEDAHKGLVALVELYERHPFLREDHPEGYLNDLWRLGGYHLAMRSYPDVEQVLSRMRTERALAGLHEAERFDKYYRLLLSYALEAQRPELAMKELEAIEAGILQYSENTPWSSQSFMVFLVARLLFVQGEYAGARRWLNHILDHPERGQREDLNSLARILLIFIYFERQDGDLAEASSRATRKYLQRRDALYKFERRILRFLEQHSFVSGKEIVAPMRQLRADLAEIFQDRLEANILAYFDILGWLDARIQQA